MNDKLPQLKAREIERALRRDGWEIRDQTGSHLQMTHSSKPGRVTIPIHKGRDVKPGTVRAIISQAGLTVEEFRRLL